MTLLQMQAGSGPAALRAGLRDHAGRTASRSPRSPPRSIGSAAPGRRRLRRCWTWRAGRRKRRLSSRASAQRSTSSTRRYLRPAAATWVNPATRSTASFESRIDPTSLPDDPDAAKASDRTDGSTAAWPLAVASARARISPGIADFLERLRRRRERDVRRLREYYEEIDLEIRRKLSRPRLDDDLRRRERDRLDATHRAFHTRGAEVADRYRVRLRLSPIGVWVCRLPAYYINVKLMRRNAAADAVFSWNPIDGRIEPRACDGCLAPTDSAWLCDDAVHYVCADCLAACRKCGRRFCRACMRACPRPHARE
jgi:hypothetical protein